MVSREPAGKEDYHEGSLFNETHSRNSCTHSTAAGKTRTIDARADPELK